MWDLYMENKVQGEPGPRISEFLFRICNTCNKEFLW